MRDFVTKIDNTAPAASGVLSADEDDMRFNEMKNAVTTAGISLDAVGGPDADLKMLAQAMGRYASGAVHMTDSGAANNYVLSSPSGPSGFVLPKALFAGMRVRFVPGATNTGAAVVNVASLGSKAIVSASGVALTGGEIVGGLLADMWYDTGITAWRLGVNASSVVVNYAADTGAANALAVTLGVVPTAYPRMLLVKVANANTGATTLAFTGSALSSVAITHENGAALVAGDIKAGMVLALLFDNTAYQIVGGDLYPKSDFLIATFAIGSVSTFNSVFTLALTSSQTCSFCALSGTRLTFSQAGTYQVEVNTFAQVSNSSDNALTWEIFTRLNGTTQLTIAGHAIVDTTHTLSGLGFNAASTKTVTVAVGDYIEVQGFTQNQFGGVVTTLPSVSYSNYIQILRK